MLLLSMKNLLVALLLLPIFSFTQTFTPKEIARFEAEAKSVTIIRDNWGVPHIYGKNRCKCCFWVDVRAMRGEF